ncbi:MAG: TorF family putative porin [Hyphomicrobium sp.]
MIKSGLGVAGLVAATALAFGGPAQAEDREFAWSTTIGGTSDYIFRGISQTREDPAFQMSVDASYGIFYAGVWGSNIDLEFPDVSGSRFGATEIDFYTGIKPVLGPVTFDLGILYYWYPQSDDPGGSESDYVEFKIGASFAPFTNASVAGAYYYTPDNFGEVGDGHTFEGTIGYTLPAIAMFTPTVSGAVGHVIGDDDDPGFLGFGDDADDNYTYWNAGLGLAVEKWVFDFRYHDTNIGDDVFCNGQALQCDARFVFTAKITLP